MKEEDTPDKWKKEDYTDGLERPWLDEQGIWEGERWNLLGTFVQWMPLFALIFAVRVLGFQHAVPFRFIFCQSG